MRIQGNPDHDGEGSEEEEDGEERGGVIVIETDSVEGAAKRTYGLELDEINENQSYLED
jgi:hypothetical protein